MNSQQLINIGISEHCVKDALLSIKNLAKNKRLGNLNLKNVFSDVVCNPESYVNDEDISCLAKSIIKDRDFVLPEPIGYKTWGIENIDAGSHDQMKVACSVPSAFKAALMPDAHVGYGLPIGGVLALENKVIPYAVGVDIACRMKLSIFDLPAGMTEGDSGVSVLEESLDKNTKFGLGCHWDKNERISHSVTDDSRWNETQLLRNLKDKAFEQMGTSGGGNHFVEFGIVEIGEYSKDLNLDKGRYLALLSHSGSRGAGSKICNEYSNIAKHKLPTNFKHLEKLGWLDMDSEAGQEYWLSMNLMGDYAAANHDCIHRRVSKSIGATIIAGVENHHNFAWLEKHDGKDVIVHRKGATPAGDGVLGVIPGSMATPAFIVRGKGNKDSIHSASHGAGRLLSRTKAKEKYNFKEIQNDLAKKGMRIVSAGADEVPGAYKDIMTVMAAQTDLVDTIGMFHPKVVKMSNDGQAED